MSLEYEVKLSGEKASQYSLLWKDIWLKGIIECSEDNITEMIPFRFRERSELKVVPLKTT